MGFSVSVVARNEGLREKMLTYMGQHFRQWHEVAPQEPAAPFPFTFEVFKGHQFGIYKVSGTYGMSRAYLYCALRWAALKVGRRRSRFSEGLHLENPVPYLVYDGIESWPIIVVKNLREGKKLQEKLRWCAFRPLGTYVSGELSDNLVHLALETMLFTQREYPKVDYNSREDRRRVAKPMIEQMLPLIEREMKRLDDLWEGK